MIRVRGGKICSNALVLVLKVFIQAFFIAQVHRVMAKQYTSGLQLSPGGCYSGATCSACDFYSKTERIQIAPIGCRLHHCDTTLRAPRPCKTTAIWPCSLEWLCSNSLRPHPHGDLTVGQISV
jgi:hypothetical protein